MSEIKNTADLRKMLLGAIDDVKEGKMKPKEASAIANLSMRVLQSAKLDLEVLKFNSANNGVNQAGDKVLQLVNG